MHLLAEAVTNNVDWCALVMAHGGAADTTTGIWSVAGRPPPLFPDAITLRPGVSAADLAAALADRRSCSVKDSFADVDLTPHGFRALFTGSWIGRPAAPARPSPDWTRVNDPAGLAVWCTTADLPHVLPARLLHEPSVRVLAARRDGVLTGGAVTTVTAAVVGVSNVFGVGEGGVWPQLASVVAHHHPGLPVVGYEHGADLGAALAAGFTELGPVRVWLRA